jgi:hypothetical protein
VSPRFPNCNRCENTGSANSQDGSFDKNEIEQQAAYHEAPLQLYKEENGSPDNYDNED